MSGSHKGTKVSKDIGSPAAQTTGEASLGTRGGSAAPDGELALRVDRGACMGPPASPAVKRRAPGSGDDSAGSSSTAVSSASAARPGPRSSKRVARKKSPIVKGGLAPSRAEIEMEIEAGMTSSSDESAVVSAAESVGESSASEGRPGTKSSRRESRRKAAALAEERGGALSRSEAAEPVGAAPLTLGQTPAAFAGVSEEAPAVRAVTPQGRSKRKKSKKKRKAAAPVAESRELSIAVEPAAPPTGLVVPATAFGGEGQPRRVELAEVVARAEQLAGEVRASTLKPDNKVVKGVASYIEERLGGIMSLLVALSGRVENLTGECAGLRSAQEHIAREVAVRSVGSGVVGPGVAPRPVAPLASGRPRTFAEAAGATPPGGPVPRPVAAGVVRPPAPPRRRPHRGTQHAVLVKAAEGASTPAEVKARLKALVNPGEASVCVTGVRSVPGGVLVETRSEADLEFFRASEAIRRGGLTVLAPEGPRTKVGVFAVPSEETEATVLTALRSQGRPDMSEEDFRAAVRVARKFDGNRAALKAANWILEATPEVATALVATGRVLLGWHSCLVREYVEVDRCFRCLGFEHTSASCRKQEQTCGSCAGSGHTASACPERGEPPCREPPCCTNCREAGL